MNPRRLLRSTLLALLAGGALLLGACSEGGKASFNAIDVTGADYAKDFALTDHNGQARTLKDFQGKVVVMFFGYTQCPDVCPTSMTELAAVKKLLGQDGDKVQGLFVTVDPERDTPEVLKAYVDNFGAGFVALRGSLDETKAVAQAFKVYFAKVPGQTPGSYTMDHTAGTYVFDAQGKVRLFTRYGSGAEALAADLRVLLAEKG